MGYDLIDFVDFEYNEWFWILFYINYILGIYYDLKYFFIRKNINKWNLIFFFFYEVW